MHRLWQQRLANNSILEFTFQLELRLKCRNTVIGMFQDFVVKVAAANPAIKFLTGYNDKAGPTEIDQNNLAFKEIRQPSCFKDYPYNRTKNMLFARVKVQSKLNFQSIKDNVVD